MIPFPTVVISFFQDFSGAPITEVNGNFSFTVINNVDNDLAFRFPLAHAFDIYGRQIDYTIEFNKANGESFTLQANEINNDNIDEITEIYLPFGMNTITYSATDVLEKETKKTIEIIYSKGISTINNLTGKVINNGKFIYKNGELFHIIKAFDNFTYPDYYANQVQPEDLLLRSLHIDLDYETPYLSGPSASFLNIVDSITFGTPINWGTSNTSRNIGYNQGIIDFNNEVYPWAGYVTLENLEGIYNKIKWQVVVLSSTEYEIFLNYWDSGKILEAIKS